MIHTGLFSSYLRPTACIFKYPIRSWYKNKHHIYFSYKSSDNMTPLPTKHPSLPSSELWGQPGLLQVIQCGVNVTWPLCEGHYHSDLHSEACGTLLGYSVCVRTERTQGIQREKIWLKGRSQALDMLKRINYSVLMLLNQQIWFPPLFACMPSCLLSIFISLWTILME